MTSVTALLSASLQLLAWVRGARRLAGRCAAKLRTLARGRPLPLVDLSRQPLVSIVLVTFNSEGFLDRLLAAVAAQSYRKYELIVVDNASTDGTVSRVRSWLEKDGIPNLLLLQRSTNIGFAAAVNQAYHVARGEFIALLNADAIPEADWLLELVTALRLHPGHSAVSPRIRFDALFTTVCLQFEGSVRLDLCTLVQALPYPKVFVRDGTLEAPWAIRSNAAGSLVLDLPAATAALHLRLLSQAGEPTQPVRLSGVFPGQLRHRSSDGLCRQDQTLVLRRDPSQAAAFWLLNNAGSTTGRWWDQPIDVGFGHRDLPLRGAAAKGDRRRFCGCSVLIRRSALLDRDPFVPEFFAYYEDSELSRWLLRHRRGPILYWPRSVLRHHHSSTLGEHSAAWRYLTGRSHRLYQLLGRHGGGLPETATSSLEVALQSLREQATASGVSAPLLEALALQDAALLRRIREQCSLLPVRRSIAVFNLFWNTHGGGEVHALQLARRLKDEYPDCHVYLLSESEFDLEHLAGYFHVDSTGLLKLVVPRVTTNFTRRFWLFVNSTSHSSLPSRACNSWYIVSFPHRTLRHHWQRGYVFIANSRYTQQWMQHRWRRCGSRSTVLYPVHQLRASLPDQPLTAHRRFLAVGRFTCRGHAKNQHLILDAFLQSLERLPQDCQLTLAGSLDTSHPEDVAYHAALLERASEARCLDRVAVEVNVTHERLRWLQSHSACLVHAAGLGMEARREPERHEHFGIAPVEAALAGCIPVVYAVGGPAEILQQTSCGCLFHGFEELVERLVEIGNLSDLALMQQRADTMRRTRAWVEQAANAPLPALRDHDDPV